jgi:hypothetical protein
MKVTIVNTGTSPIRLQYINKDVDVEVLVGESKEVDIPSGTEIVDFAAAGETAGEKQLQEQAKNAGGE